MASTHNVNCKLAHLKAQISISDIQMLAPQKQSNNKLTETIEKVRNAITDRNLGFQERMPIAR